MRTKFVIYEFTTQQLAHFYNENSRKIHQGKFQDFIFPSLIKFPFPSLLQLRLINYFSALFCAFRRIKGDWYSADSRLSTTQSRRDADENIHHSHHGQSDNPFAGKPQQISSQDISLLIYCVFLPPTG